MSSRLIQLTSTSLPIAARPPGFVVAVGDTVHLVASNESNRGTVHALLDHDGLLLGPAITFDISVLTMRACGNEVVAAGTRMDHALRYAISVNAAGEVVWETRLPLPSDRLLWIAPVCVSGRAMIVWEAEGEDDAEFGIAEVVEGRLETVATFSQDGIAYGMHAVAIGERIFVLRSRGSEIGADLLCIEGGAVTARAKTLKNAQAIAAVDNRLVVLAWTTGAVLLQWLDASLQPLADAETIATAGAPSWIRFATLHAASEERIAVSYLTGYSDDLVSLPGGRSEPGQYARHFLGRYEAGSQRLVDVAELLPSGTAWIDGTWVGDRLLFVHGTSGAALTIFQLTAE